MDLKQLRYFSAVVEQGSISAAARALFMSQPPLSAQVRQLEKELGVRLFDREGHKLTLTPAGKLLYDRAQGLLDSAHSVESELRAFGRGGSRILRLGAVSSICSSDLPLWLRAFFRDNPGIRLELTEQDTYALLEKLRARQLDLALIRTPFSSDGLDCRVVRREKMMALGERRFFPEGAPGGKLTVAALASLPLIVYRRWMQPLGESVTTPAPSPPSPSGGSGSGWCRGRQPWRSGGKRSCGWRLKATLSARQSSRLPSGRGTARRGFGSRCGRSCAASRSRKALRRDNTG